MPPQGYAVTPDREDYRVSLETVWAPQIDDALRTDASPKLAMEKSGCSPDVHPAADQCP
ncbi:hypothetical protein GCM10010112_40560 [Actinoplanes lobatus]|uniref:Uncharacterized protein n=1 Tax=Actinoplanes lobatus TaxID=113568 RepID=A0A7W7MKT5_9ACTN|nr:hypothetical protein [Actinoplanes lobatus]MBB4753828.1 hypothetical protein [Actinoplanes lobatus]GGN72359.1 hypothetical protein GCM10010112_40560 [Actinoplanes lobatus]GIE42018.1 hypothetical protein Alo02nite_49160 [Actinoplanes lobatus]